MSWAIDYMDVKRDSLDFIVMESAFLKIDILIQADSRMLIRQTPSGKTIALLDRYST